MQGDPTFRTVRGGESIGKRFQYPHKRWEELFSVYKGDRAQRSKIICLFHITIIIKSHLHPNKGY